jgi:hypothetical protein
LILNKHSVVKDKELIKKQMSADEEIQIDKIKKYFENVLNEQHFINNYGKAKMRSLEAEGVISGAPPAPNEVD